MKKIIPLLIAVFSVIAANAQPNCNASLTWTQVPNSQSITFTNTSTASATPSTPFASTSRWVIIGSQWYAANPTYTHSFPAPGTYQVVAMVNYLDSIGGFAVSCQDTAQYTVVVAPSPCFTTLSMSNVGSTYTFTASTPGAGSTPVTYNWSISGMALPNPVSMTGNPITYTFPASGSYSVSLMATSGNCYDSAMISPIQITTPLNCAMVSNSFSTSGSGGLRTFWPIGTPNTYSRTNYWDFGNGFTAVTTGNNSATTMYTAPGTYNACLITVWHDSANNISCSDTACQSLTVTNTGGTFNCANASSTFNVSGTTGWWRTFVPSVTPANTAGVTVQNFWDFGDGSTATTTGTQSTPHLFWQNGVYNVCLVTRWIQAGTTNVLCTDTTCQTVTISVPVQNFIDGYVVSDSTNVIDTFKVWLISYDPQTTLLTAVDSVVAVGHGNAGFSFWNKPAGVYRTKAHKINQTTSSFGYVPTYRDSSFTWSGAQTFNHNNGTTYSGPIYLRQGLVTSGPGFVGGSVLSGANKGTADGDPVANQLVFLRDASTGALVQSTYTNSTGQYGFSNLPLGTYTIYPEEMNYATTPSAPLTLTAGSASVSGIIFKKDDVDLDIKQVTTSVRNVTGGSLAFTVTPNPTTGRLVLSVSGGKAAAADVRVLSVTGQTVFTSTMNTAATSTLDLSHLPAGVYSVMVTSEAAAGTARVVIAR